MFVYEAGIFACVFGENVLEHHVACIPMGKNRRAIKLIRPETIESHLTPATKAVWLSEFLVSNSGTWTCFHTQIMYTQQKLTKGGSFKIPSLHWYKGGWFLTWTHGWYFWTTLPLFADHSWILGIIIQWIWTCIVIHLEFFLGMWYKLSATSLSFWGFYHLIIIHVTVSWETQNKETKKKRHLTNCNYH